MKWLKLSERDYSFLSEDEDPCEFFPELTEELELENNDPLRRGPRTTGSPWDMESWDKYAFRRK